MTGTTGRSKPRSSAPQASLLTLALLEDVSALLVLHGYPPLRGYALAEITLCLQRIHTP